MLSGNHNSRMAMAMAMAMAMGTGMGIVHYCNVNGVVIGHRLIIGRFPGPY